MKIRIAAIALLLICGCVQVSPVVIDEEPPAPVASETEKASRELIIGFADAWAANAEQAAGKAESYKSWSEALGELSRINRLTKSTSCEAFSRAVEESSGDEKYDAKRFSETALEVARGLRGAADDLRVRSSH